MCACKRVYIPDIASSGRRRRGGNPVDGGKPLFLPLFRQRLMQAPPRPPAIPTAVPLSCRLQSPRLHFCRLAFLRSNSRRDSNNFKLVDRHLTAMRAFYFATASFASTAFNKEYNNDLLVFFFFFEILKKNSHQEDLYI